MIYPLYLLCWVNTFVQLLVKKKNQHCFDPLRPITLITSYVVHHNVDHYYINVLLIYTMGNQLIKDMISQPQWHILALMCCTHVVACYLTIWINPSDKACGSSVTLYLSIAIVLCVKWSTVLQVSGLLSFLIAAILFDVLSEYKPKRLLLPRRFETKPAHLAHAVGYLGGFAYWRLWMYTPDVYITEREDRFKYIYDCCLNVFSAPNMKTESHVVVSVLAFTACYLYQFYRGK
jgi:membrane associated rhomboid family serine protease